jgi:hypothetical protein
LYCYQAETIRFVLHPWVGSSAEKGHEQLWSGELSTRSVMSL